MNRAVVSPWVDTVLGADRNQRVRLTQSLVASSLYLGLSAIIWLGVWMGAIQLLPAAALTSLVLVASLVFFAVIRSGRNLRFTADPALTQVQGLFSVFACSAAYAVSGPIRGAMLMLLLTGQFFGVFSLTPPQARRTAVVAVLALGLTMAWCAYTDPVQFPPQVELLSFLLVALVLPSLRSPATRDPALLGAAVALAVTPFLPSGLPVLCALAGLVLARPGRH